MIVLPIWGDAGAVKAYISLKLTAETQEILFLLLFTVVCRCMFVVKI
jgi:hypothetical protein